MKQRELNIIGHFNKWAENGRSDIMASGHMFSVNKMMQNAPSNDSFSFLDIGCGNGWVVREMANLQNCSASTGIDISDVMISVAKNRTEAANASYICEDLLRWKCDDQYDFIISMEVFYYISPIKEALVKANALLKDGGRILIGVDYYRENEASHGWPDMLGLEMLLMSSDEWVSQMYNAGFKNVTAENVRDQDSEEDWKRDYGTLVISATK